MSTWKRLSGLLLVGIMVATPYVGEYVKNRIDAAHYAVADATAPERSGLTPAPAGFGGALGPTPARADGGGERSLDEVHGIKVYGEPWFGKKVRQAIGLLREKDPDGYRLVVENIREIRPDKNVRKETGGWAAVNPATGVVRYTPWDEEPTGMAYTLVHEAMHVYLYRNGMPYSGEEGEKLASERAGKTYYLLTSK